MLLQAAANHAREAMCNRRWTRSFSRQRQVINPPEELENIVAQRDSGVRPLFFSRLSLARGAARVRRLKYAIAPRRPRASRAGVHSGTVFCCAAYGAITRVVVLQVKRRR